MWDWSLNWNVIRYDMAIGSCPRRASDLDILRAETGVSAVLSLQHDECLEQHGIDYPHHVRHGCTLRLMMKRCPLRDFDPDDQRRSLPDAIRTLHQLLRQDHRVYIHCTAGINRSPLVVLSYFTLVEGQSLEKALAFLQRARPGAYPTLEAYDGCRRDLIKKYKDRIDQRAVQLGRQLSPQGIPDYRLQAEQEILRDALTAAESAPSSS